MTHLTANILIIGIIFALGLESGVAMTMDNTRQVDRVIIRNVDRPVFIPSRHMPRVKIDVLAAQIDARQLRR